MKEFFRKVWTWIISHKAIAIATASVVVAGATCAIVLPIALHEHSYSEEWRTDATNHWHVATCQHEEEIEGLEAHTYDNACDTDCNVCGYERTVGAHVYDNGCDTTCNTCGATRTVEPHVYDNACDTKCNVCEAERTVEPHVYDNACDTKCNVCEAERTVEPHVYDNACDTTCNVCTATRTITHNYATVLTQGETTHYYACSVCGDKKDETAHVYDNACDTKCNECEAERTVGAHVYDNACDTKCNVCEAERTVEPHVYDNACDTKCNVCEAERTVEPHVYDNACDTTCNVCGATRTVEPHVYDNACDTTCNVCTATRTITHDYATVLTQGETTHYYACSVCGDKKDETAHVYDNACDTTCNVCNAERTVGAHVYDNACDTTCNVCGETRTVGAHVYDNACDTTCNECNATRTITHDHADTLTAGETTHWYACSVCGDKKDEASHVFDKTVENSEYLKEAATATTKAQYYKSCACGEKSTTEYFEVDKIVTTITNIQDISKTYDGTAVVTPTYQTNSTGAVLIEWSRSTGLQLVGAPTLAGVYKVIITIEETETHAAARVEQEFTIAKKQDSFSVAPTMSAVTIVYGDNYFVNEGETEGDGDVTVEYKVRGADDTTYTTTQPIDKGLYTARITVEENKNYLSVSATVDFEIEARVLEWVDGYVTYNGAAVHEIDLSTEGYYGVTVEVTFDGADNTSELIGVKVLENGDETENYVLDIDNCGVTIIARVVDIEWTAPANLQFDGTEKEASAIITNLISGDECTLTPVLDGDNVWFGSTFTYTADIAGADVDNGNYALPDNVNSPEYTITIDTVEVGEACDVGATSLYDGVLYYAIELETGYYYFDYVSATQGVGFTFELFAKGETAIPLVEFSVEDQNKASAVFYIETAGSYYVKSTTADITQGEKLTIKAHAHGEMDTYGFCSGCGMYLGEELSTNSWTTCSLGGDAVTKAYYRFADGYDVRYNLKYASGSDGSGLSVKCYRTTNEGEIVEVGLSETATEFEGSFDGYYYLVIRYMALQGTSKTFTFQVEETI